MISPNPESPMKTKLVLLTLLLALASPAAILMPQQRLPMPGSSAGSNPYCASLSFRDGPTALGANGWAWVQVNGEELSPATYDIKWMDSKNHSGWCGPAGNFPAVLGRRYYFTVYFLKAPARGSVVELQVGFE